MARIPSLAFHLGFGVQAANVSRKVRKIHYLNQYGRRFNARCLMAVSHYNPNSRELPQIDKFEDSWNFVIFVSIRDVFKIRLRHR